MLLAAGAVAGMLALAPAHAQETVKIGLILPMTGGQASTGKQIDNAVKLYMQQNGDTVAGKKIEVILKDDGGVPDVTKRLAHELVENDKVNILAGFGTTPSAIAVAPLVTQMKMPQVVMSAATSIVTERSPYTVRTSTTLPQSCAIIGEWAAKSGIKKVAILVADYAPGNDALQSFKDQFTARGGHIVDEVKVAISKPDFGPALERIKDANPDAMFVYVPSRHGEAFVKKYAEHNMKNIRVIGTGEILDDEALSRMGDTALGFTTAHFYSAMHPTKTNRDFVEAYTAAYSMRPGFMAVSGYDGIHLIYEALKKTGGKMSGDALVGAMRGMSWESPRGPITIDDDTRDVVHNIYIRRVERVKGELYNVEFEHFGAVRDPGKSRK
jgi:branched-chain amino acid transport system substrate-binding protein